MRTARARWIVLLGWTLLSSGASAAAQRAARSAEEWIRLLENPARVSSLRVEMVLDRLRIQPAQVVADLGAGAGAFSLPFAKAVGPAGKVYAVDIDKGLVDHIAGKATAAGFTNLRPVLGQFSDPALPAADVDLAFVHDVLHHIEAPGAYIRSAARYLKAGGRFAVIEPDGARGPHASDPALQVSVEQVQRWMTDAGLSFVERLPDYDGKWFVIYTKQ